MKKRPITVFLILIITFFFSMINVKAECSDGWLVECYYVTGFQEHVATIRYKKSNFEVEIDKRKTIGNYPLLGFDIEKKELDAAYDESPNGCLTNLYYSGDEKLIFANHYKHTITIGENEKIALFESKSCLKENNGESSEGNSQKPNVELNIPENITCNTLLGDPHDEDHSDPAFYILIAFKVIKYVSIALLVVLSTIDFVGAIASSDNDILKKTINKILKRFILCILIFLLPTLIEFILQYMYDQSVNLCGIK